jgi:methylated-DNA-[protein]-cysteine S-methyltransferase
MRAEITVNSPLGPLTVTEEDGAIVALRFGPAAGSGSGKASGEESETPVLIAAATQLDAYFYCGLKTFDLPLAPKGSESERAIWALMNAIPFGETRSYGEIARAANDPAHRPGAHRIGAQAVGAQAVGAQPVGPGDVGPGNVGPRDVGPRDVGLACGRNPIPIIQPCHRVLAAGGALGGFSAPGGVETKLALLRHEGAMLL